MKPGRLIALPTEKGQEQKAVKQEFHLIGSVFEKEKFPVWTEESRKCVH